MPTHVSNPRPPRGTWVDWDDPPVAGLEVHEDHTREILAKNASPDVPFRWSLNPYRGCTHACAYCYARRSHEHLDWGAGTDFERRILVKRQAPRLLEEALSRRSWTGEVVALSGNTDCYQPLERKLGLTRACLEVFARFRNPVQLITRSPLVTRDLDLLLDLHAHRAVTVTISIPIADPDVCRRLEPGAPPPSARLKAMRALADAGIPVGLSLAPLSPGVHDRGMGEALTAAREAGAAWAFTQLVRLTDPVAQVFEERLREGLPERADAVLARIRRARGGELSDARFGSRMTGHGEAWATTQRLFEIQRSRLGYGDPPPVPAPSPFRRPGEARQVALF